MKFSISIATLMVVASTQAFVIPTGKNAKSGFVVPLHTNPSYKPNFTRQIARAQCKHKSSLISSSSSKQGSVPLIDDNDVEYRGLVKVGTPGVTFSLDFDTGSSDLWVPAVNCKAGCKGKASYDPKESSTFKKDGTSWNITYGDGSNAKGALAVDTVNLGGLVIKGQTIAVATTVVGFDNRPIDGLMGLAFDTITSVPGTKTPLDNIISQNLVDQSIFGVFLGKASNGGGGEYIFGGFDKTKIDGKLTTVPVDSSNGFWGIDVSSVAVGKKKVLKKFSAIIDTGTTLLLFPQAEALKVAALYKANDKGDGTFNITCDPKGLPDLTLNIAAGKFKIPAADLIIPDSFSFDCIAGFGAFNSTFAILGDTFIKNNYVVFDPSTPQVMMAPLAGL